MKQKNYWLIHNPVTSVVPIVVPTLLVHLIFYHIFASARPALHHVEPTKRKTIMQKSEPCKLCFNFKRIRKKEVYQAFLEIYAHGGIELNNQELISFLARHTNLGSEASITTLFYRYKQHVHV